MPKGEGFVEFPVFEHGYESLKRATEGFRRVTADTVAPVVIETPIALIVLRCMLGFTPLEWAWYASRHTGVEVTQGAARSIDRNIRMNPEAPLPTRVPVTERRIRALVAAACHALQSGVSREVPGTLHRLDKADTRNGLFSVRSSAELGVPYSMLLYERLLGRPFAGHRDSISELVGDIVENAIESVLSRAGISFRKTKRAEGLPGFDQAPDFVIPNEFNPRIVIEAKLTEDDGTARDKVTRVQHLGALSLAGRPEDEPKFEVVACIGGTRLRRAPRGHEEALARDPREGVHPSERAPARRAYPSCRLPIAVIGAPGRYSRRLRRCATRWSRATAAAHLPPEERAERDRVRSRGTEAPCRRAVSRYERGLRQELHGTLLLTPFDWSSSVYTEHCICGATRRAARTASGAGAAPTTSGKVPSTAAASSARYWSVCPEPHRPWARQPCAKRKVWIRSFRSPSSTTSRPARSDAMCSPKASRCGLGGPVSGLGLVIAREHVADDEIDEEPPDMAQPSRDRPLHADDT